MNVVSIISWPLESGEEVGKRFVEMPQLPDYISMRGPYVNSTIEGVQAITIYEFDESRYAEAFRAVNNRIANYIGISGLTYSVSHWLDVQDALKLVGM